MTWIKLLNADSALQKEIVNDAPSLKILIADAFETWQSTLHRFGIGIVNMSLGEEVQLARLIKMHGLSDTKLALLGAGFESGSEQFRPSEHVSIRRVSDQKNFEKFLNLGRQQKSRAENFNAVFTPPRKTP